MKLALIQCANGAFTIVSEHGDNEQSALVAFHNQCRIMWNSPDAYKVEVAIVDEQLDIYKGYKELITHEQPEEVVEE